MKRIVSILLCMAMVTGLLIFSGCTGKEEEPVITTPLLRVGILSDIHSNMNPAFHPLERIEKAFLFYKQKGVDAIMISGDLLDIYSQTALMDLQDVWLSVFPNNINDLTGERVEPLFIYGNHDEGLIEDEFWFDALGSEYEDAWIKEIKGYQFVGAHYSKENTALVQKLITQAEDASAGKPWFYTQHVPMPDTVIGGMESYDGKSSFGTPMYELLKKSYNCVVFTGHTHIPITDERSIWQSTNKKEAQFTAINCGTMYYGFLGDFSDLDINGDKYQTQQGMYMVVDGSQITIERYSFADMELTYENGAGKIHMQEAKKIGQPWVFDAVDKKNRPYDYEDRTEAAHLPIFVENASLEITELTTNSVAVTIPAATVTAPEGYSDLVQSYYVEVTNPTTGETVKTVEIAAPYHINTEPKNLQKSVSVQITGLNANTEYAVLVYARECYQKSSEPLAISVTTPEF